MPKNESSFTVYFDPPFWVGVYQRQEGSRLEVCRTVFGREPREQEVYEFLLAHWKRLQFGPAVKAEALPVWPDNPKRRQREIRRELERSGVAGTKAQQALQAQREERKTEGKRQRKEQKAAQEEQKFTLRQTKRREKHEGR